MGRDYALKLSLGTAVCQATAILQTILAVDLSMPWLREAANVGIPWGELLSCLPSRMGERTGSHDKSPVV